MKLCCQAETVFPPSRMLEELRNTTIDLATKCDSNITKFGKCLGANGTDSHDAHRNDQRQHDGVLNRCWSIFINQKIDSP